MTTEEKSIQKIGVCCQQCEHRWYMTVAMPAPSKTVIDAIDNLKCPKCGNRPKPIVLTSDEDVKQYEKSLMPETAAEPRDYAQELEDRIP